MEIVYEALRRRRMFAYELAQQVGIPETRLRRILKRRLRARPDELKRIAAALGLSQNELIEEAA